MILYGEDWLVLQAQTFHRVIIQINLGDDRARRFQLFTSRSETVVLCGDRNFTGLKVLDRLIASAVAEFKLKGLRTDRMRNDLMAEADTESWIVLDQFFHRLMRIANCTWVTRAIGEKHTIRLNRFDFVR